MRKPKPRAADTAHSRPLEVERDNIIATTPGLRARLAAQAILTDVVTGGRSLESRFDPDSVSRRTAGLSPEDVALVRSIVTAGLRRLGGLRRNLNSLLEKGLPKQAPQVEWILLTALTQIFLLDIPDHAAVDLAVRTARLDAKTAPFAALINAVLRNAIRQREELELSMRAPLLNEAPNWLTQRWEKNWGLEQAQAIVAAHATQPTLDLTVKDSPELWAQKLGGVLLPSGSVRIEALTPPSELDGYATGDFWVQNAAAALPVKLAHVLPGERVLDLCAAPGGKTAQLAQLGAEVTAVDRSAERLKTLAANLQRLSLSANLVVADGANFDAEPFDLVLVDAPCSSTGVIRRHPDIQWIKRPSDLETLGAVQRRLLDKGAALTKPSGRLIYSVCSIEPEEGEKQIAAFLRKNPDWDREAIAGEEIGAPQEWVNEAGELRILPSFWPDPNPRLAGIDGFFIARLRRRG